MAAEPFSAQQCLMWRCQAAQWQRELHTDFMDHQLGTIISLPRVAMNGLSMQHHHASAEQARPSMLPAMVKRALQKRHCLHACPKLMAFIYMDTKASHLHAAAQVVLSVRGMQMQGC